jgi:6-phosphogluconolactonase
VVAKIRENDGKLEMLQEIPSIAEVEEWLPYPAPAAIKIHPSGKTLAVSNRFRDSVAVFEIIRLGGEMHLAFSGEYPCGGKTPRDIEFSADGSYLLVANQDSHIISCLNFSSDNGLFSGKFGPELEIGSPACIVRI